MMPDVSFVLTNSVTRSWGNYWSRRPNDEPLDLVETLRSSEVVTDFEPLGIRPESDCEFWSHSQIPGVVFAVKRNAVECVPLALIGTKLPKAKAFDVIPPPPPTVILDEPAVDVGECPNGSAQERWTWASLQYTRICDWLSRAREAHPHRGVMKQALARVQRLIRIAKEEIARERDRTENETENDGEVRDGNGKLMIAPNVRWLLREVKELREQVAELKTRMKDK